MFSKVVCLVKMTANQDSVSIHLKLMFSCTTFSEENSPRDVTQTEPLPAIPTTEKVTVPDVPMVIVMGKIHFPETLVT